MTNKETFKLSDIERKNREADKEKERRMYANKLTLVLGWNGGHWKLGGKKVDFKDKPEVLVWIDGKSFPACYRETKGSDYDHGHSYPWTRMDIGIEDGSVLVRFLSAIDLLREGRSVFVTKKDSSVLVLREPNSQGKVLAVIEEPCN